VFKAGQMSYGMGETAPAVAGGPSDPAPPAPSVQCDPPTVPVEGLETKHEVGKLAPEIALPSPGGGTVRLSDHRGKVVVLAFWSVDCAKCMEEVPELNELQAEHEAECFTVLGVNVFDNLARTGATARNKGMTYPVVAAAAEGAEAPEYNIAGVPVLIVVDRWGVITWEGSALTEAFHQALEKALAADPELPRGEQRTEAESPGA
jgi:peroxiredoxin